MTFYELLKSLNLLSTGISLFGFLIGLYYYRSLSIVHKGITLYLFGMFLIDVVSRVIGATGNNFIVLLIYSLLEMAFFTYFYFKYFFDAKHRLVLVLSCIAFLYILWEIILFEATDLKGFQSYAKVVDDFIIIILVLSFFHEKINIFKESKWNNFGLNATILVFYSINLIFFLPLNFLINESSGLKFYFWFGNTLSLILFYSYLSYSIWKNGRTQKLLLSGSR